MQLYRVRRLRDLAISLKSIMHQICGYDFEIFCTNSSCPLNKNWFGGSPMGGVNDTSVNMSSDDKHF